MDDDNKVRSYSDQEGLNKNKSDGLITSILGFWVLVVGTLVLGVNSMVPIFKSEDIFYSLSLEEIEELQILGFGPELFIIVGLIIFLISAVTLGFLIRAYLKGDSRKLYIYMLILSIVILLWLQSVTAIILLIGSIVGIIQVKKRVGVVLGSTQ